MEGDYTWKCKRGHTIGKDYSICQLCLLQDFREEMDKLKADKTKEKPKEEQKNNAE